MEAIVASETEVSEDFMSDEVEAKAEAETLATATPETGSGVASSSRPLRTTSLTMPGRGSLRLGTAALVIGALAFAGGAAATELVDNTNDGAVLKEKIQLHPDGFETMNVFELLGRPDYRTRASDATEVYMDKILKSRYGLGLRWVLDSYQGDEHYLYIEPDHVNVRRTKDWFSTDAETVGIDRDVITFSETTRSSYIDAIAAANGSLERIQKLKNGGLAVYGRVVSEYDSKNILLYTHATSVFLNWHDHEFVGRVIEPEKFDVEVCNQRRASIRREGYHLAAGMLMYAKSPVVTSSPPKIDYAEIGRELSLANLHRADKRYEFMSKLSGMDGIKVQYHVGVEHTMGAFGMYVMFGGADDISRTMLSAIQRDDPNLQIQGVGRAPLIGSDGHMIYPGSGCVIVHMDSEEQLQTLKQEILDESRWLVADDQSFFIRSLRTSDSGIEIRPIETIEPFIGIENRNLASLDLLRYTVADETTVKNVIEVTKTSKENMNRLLYAHRIVMDNMFVSDSIVLRDGQTSRDPLREAIESDRPWRGEEYAVVNGIATDIQKQIGTFQEIFGDGVVVVPHVGDVIGYRRNHVIAMIINTRTIKTVAYLELPKGMDPSMVQAIVNGQLYAKVLSGKRKYDAIVLVPHGTDFRIIGPRTQEEFSLNGKDALRVSVLPQFFDTESNEWNLEEVENMKSLNGVKLTPGAFSTLVSKPSCAYALQDSFIPPGLSDIMSSGAFLTCRDALTEKDKREINGFEGVHVLAKNMKNVVPVAERAASIRLDAERYENVKTYVSRYLGVGLFNSPKGKLAELIVRGMSRNNVREHISYEKQHYFVLKATDMAIHYVQRSWGWSFDSIFSPTGNVNQAAMLKYFDDLIEIMELDTELGDATIEFLHTDVKGYRYISVMTAMFVTGFVSHQLTSMSISKRDQHVYLYFVTTFVFALIFEVVRFGSRDKTNADVLNDALQQVFNTNPDAAEAFRRGVVEPLGFSVDGVVDAPSSIVPDVDSWMLTASAIGGIVIALAINMFGESLPRFGAAWLTGGLSELCRRTPCPTRPAPAESDDGMFIARTDHNASVSATPNVANFLRRRALPSKLRSNGDWVTPKPITRASEDDWFG
jgi:hypothetical protein